MASIGATGAFWTYCHETSRVFPTDPRKSLMRGRSEKCNNRQYDARTQLSGDSGGGAVAGGDEREP